MRVVDEAEHRSLPRDLRQQRKGGHRDQEPVRRLPRLQPERDTQGPRLWFGQLLRPVQNRAQEAVQGREGEHRLRLDPYGAQHAHAVRPLGGV